MSGVSSLDGRFPTTRLSAVLGSGSTDEPERERAWHALVRAYWKPAYKHVRLRWRMSREDAQDATQGFFERAMQKDFFAGYDPARARFRTFLRTCLDRFASNERKAERRLKRGGGQAALSLDFDAAEAELEAAGSSISPEEIFDREWRRSVFGAAIEALQQRCRELDKQSCYVAFERYDLCAPEERPTYDELGKALGVPATTITNYLSWARRELRARLIAQLEGLTATEAELEQEARALLGSL